MAQFIDTKPHASDASVTLSSPMGEHLGQEVLGVALLVVGAALTLTLWLMPLGAPLALLGIGMISAPSR